jgi:ATP-binding cassette, subfamily F, member 3
VSLLTVSQISKSYFGRVVLNQVSFRLDRGERLALIGDNGAGKTTLLRLITGTEAPDQGFVSYPSQVIPGYLSQHFDEDELADADSTALASRELTDLEEQLRDLEIRMADTHEPAAQAGLLSDYGRLTERFEALGGYDFARLMRETLAGLGLAGDVLIRPLATLSGGERMRVALARILLRSPDLLLLDEPTNHLDLQAIEWLEDFLSRFKGAVLFVSHDRTFIDHTATAVAELADGRMDIRQGGYSHFVTVRAAEQAALAKEIRLLAGELERQQEVTQTMLSHRKMASYHAREKVVGRLSGRLDEMSARASRQNRRLNFNFQPDLSGGDPHRILLLAENLSFGFGERPLFRDVSLELRRGGKTALCGPNGCGKTTLLGLLTGRIDGFAGSIRLIGPVICGHMGQHVDFSDEANRLIDELAGRAELTEEQVRSLLARYGFRDVDVYKKISVLSGGERSRLYLCCLLLEQPDLLILDEPTNHLDIQSREILENALIDFPGAILAVSHDRYFIEHCTPQVLGFIGDQVLPFASYAEYSARQRLAGAKAPPPAPPAAGSRLPDGRGAALPAARGTAQDAGGESPAKARPTGNRAQERRETALFREKLRRLEQTIADLEQRRRDFEAGFVAGSDPAVYTQYTELLAELDRRYDEYLEMEQSEAGNEVR